VEKWKTEREPKNEKAPIERPGLFEGLDTHRLFKAGGGDFMLNALPKFGVLMSHVLLMH